jgi:hypothetical protein
MIKNTASQVVSFQMVSSTDGSNVTTGTPTVYVTGDGGAQATGSGAKTHEGNGCWSYAVSAADSNYDHVSFTMVLTGAISQTVNVYPVTLSSYKADVSGLATSSALATVSGKIDTIDGIVDTILVDTNELQTNQGNWTTATGFSTHSAADVKTAIESAGSSIAQILEDTGTSIPSSITDLNDISVVDIIAGIADGSYDLQDMIRIMFAALAGKSAGGGTSTITFRDVADSKNRISATVDSNGNRTAISLDES